MPTIRGTGQEKAGGNNKAAIAILVLGTSATVVILLWSKKWKTSSRDSTSLGTFLTAYEQLIEAGTPLIKLRRVSKLIERSIFVKMESLNPGGTGKDRAALNMIRSAESQGLLPKPKLTDSLSYGDELFLNPRLPIISPSVKDHISGTDAQLEAMILETFEKSLTGGIVIEGTSGSTGISLATLCASRGHGCLVVLPDDQAEEKQLILCALGAVVFVVPTAAISNPKHYVNLGRKAAQVARDKYEISAVFINQFENEANYEIHYQRTGPELWKQMRGRIDAFVMSSGTGGTISGISSFLKQVHPSVTIVLVDPPGSSLYNKIQHGVAYAVEQQERTLRKHRYDTLAEGIGLDRVTHNFELGLAAIDRAIRISDQQAVDMAHWILRTEGLWVGSSSAMNIVGAIETALDMPKDSRVVTMICDGGHRHATRFWSRTFIQEWDLEWPDSQNVPECLRPVLLRLEKANLTGYNPKTL